MNITIIRTSEYTGPKVYTFTEVKKISPCFPESIAIEYYGECNSSPLDEAVKENYKFTVFSRRLIKKIEIN